MAKKRPELSAWGKYMKLGLIIGSFLYGVSKKKQEFIIVLLLK